MSPRDADDILVDGSGELNPAGSVRDCVRLNPSKRQDYRREHSCHQHSQYGRELSNYLSVGEMEVEESVGFPHLHI